MKPNIFKISSFLLLIIFQGCSPAKTITRSPKILVFSATGGSRHASIKDGKMALLKMGLEKNWGIDTTEDATRFTDTNLKQYSAVVFLNTTGNILNEKQQMAFQKYIQAGGGFVGIHAAADTEHDWPWYNNLVGAYFENHPKPQMALYKSSQ
jgi:type 1 glutamine amidotransferase